MPNWVINKIYLKGKDEDIKKVLTSVKSEESDFDFNKIIEMPKSLDIDSGYMENEAIVVFISEKLNKNAEEIKDNKFAKLIHNMFDKDFLITTYNRLKNRNLSEEELNSLYKNGEIYCSNYEKYGATSWYSWCCTNWGTKWNASNVYVEGNEISFNTAWSCPCGILEAFADICKTNNVSFSGYFADEDCGQNTGTFTTEGIFYNEDGSSEAYETYVNCWGESMCLGKDEEGNFVHYQCDNCPNKGLC